MCVENNYRELPDTILLESRLNFTIDIITSIIVYIKEKELSIDWAEMLEALKIVQLRVNGIQNRYKEAVRSKEWEVLSEIAELVRNEKEEILDSQVYLEWKKHQDLYWHRLSMQEPNFYETEIRIQVINKLQEFKAEHYQGLADGSTSLSSLKTTSNVDQTNEVIKLRKQLSTKDNQLEQKSKDIESLKSIINMLKNQINEASKAKVEEKSKDTSINLKTDQNDYTTSLSDSLSTSEDLPIYKDEIKISQFSNEEIDNKMSQFSDELMRKGIMGKKRKRMMLNEKKRLFELYGMNFNEFE